MTAAEKWNEYEARYKKYGVDMTPAVPRKEKKQTLKKSGLRASDRLHILELLFLTGALCIAMVITTAYAAKVQYNINQEMAECDALRGDIQNLEVEVKSATNIETIEQKATEEMGLIYPASTDMAYVDCSGEKMEEFSLALKEHAYSVN